MNQTTAKIFIACGAFAAAVGGAGTAILVVGSRAGNQGIAYVVPAIFIGLAYGLYRKSRVCALIAFVAFAGMRVQSYEDALKLQQMQGGNVMRGFWVSVIVFGLLYLLGVIGTFMWHAMQPESEAPAAGN